MNIANFLNSFEGDIKEVAAFIQGKTPSLIEAFQIASKASQAFVTAAQSPEGIVIENLIASFIPQAKAWTADAIVLSQEFGKTMTLVAGHIPSVEAIALRYCSELVTIIAGIQTPIGNTIAEVQKMYLEVKSGIPITL